VVQVVTGDSQEEVIIFRYRHTNRHCIIIYISSFHGGDDDVGFLKRTNDILKLLKLIVEVWIMTNDD